ncbi:MAG: hypothetical protein C4308_01260 [Chitinophagaceae bacterium]
MSSAGTSSPPNALRTILIGVTTTVLGTTAIYFLGFNNKGNKSSASTLEVKDATINAWKS